MATTNERLREWDQFSFWNGVWLSLACIGLVRMRFWRKDFYDFNISKAKVKMKSRLGRIPRIHSVSKECHHWQSVFAWRNAARFVKFRIRTYKCALFGKWNTGGEFSISVSNQHSTQSNIPLLAVVRVSSQKKGKWNVSNVIHTHTHFHSPRLRWIKAAKTTDFACYVRFQSESMVNNKKYAHSTILPIRSQQASIKLTA